MSILFGKTMQWIESGMTARRERQGVVASNIANAETPGYHARRLNFAETFDQATNNMAMKPTRSDHMTASGRLQGAEGSMMTSDGNHAAGAGAAATGTSPSVDVREGAGKVDGNNVNLEEEMSLLATNAMEYQGMTAMARKKFGLLRYAITQS